MPEFVNIESIIFILIVGFVCYKISIRIRSLEDGQAFAIFELGVLKGLIVVPGLNFKYASEGISQWVKIRVGQSGVVTGSGFAVFGKHTLPISGETDGLRDVVIDRFEPTCVVVKPQLSNVLVCEKCGHENHSQHRESKT